MKKKNETQSSSRLLITWDSSFISLKRSVLFLFSRTHTHLFLSLSSRLDAFVSLFARPLEIFYTIQSFLCVFRNIYIYISEVGIYPKFNNINIIVSLVSHVDTTLPLPRCEKWNNSVFWTTHTQVLFPYIHTNLFEYYS